VTTWSVGFNLRHARARTHTRTHRPHVLASGENKQGGHVCEKNRLHRGKTSSKTLAGTPSPKDAAEATTHL